MRTLLYPGSFDPMTMGHLDIIARASRLTSKLVVGVLHNPQKPSGLFPLDKRMDWLRTGCAGLPGVEVRAFSGLLIDAVVQCGAEAVVRGLRTEADFALESEMARLNWQMKGVETVFLIASPAVVHISASRVREIGRLGGGLQGLVPESIRESIEKGFVG